MRTRIALGLGLCLAFGLPGCGGHSSKKSKPALASSASGITSSTTSGVSSAPSGSSTPSSPGATSPGAGHASWTAQCSRPATGGALQTCRPPGFASPVGYVPGGVHHGAGLAHESRAARWCLLSIYLQYTKSKSRSCKGCNL